MMAAIVLTGLSGSGKTSVGTALSERLGWPFIDTDTLVEEDSGSAIAEIFTDKGETAFRELETKILEKLLAESSETEADSGRIVSTGGGAVVSQHNRQLLKALGKVVFLTAPVKVLAARLSGDATRPLLNANDNQLNNYPESEQTARLISKLENLLQSRKAAYMEADLIIDTSDLGAHDIANKIQELLSL